MFLLLLCPLAVPPSAARASSDESVLIDGVAADVNKHVVTVGEVLMSMEPVRRQLLAQYEGKELRARLEDAYREALDSQIERYVVLDAYEAGEGRIPDWAVDKRADEVMRESFDGDRTALLSALSRESLTYEEWRKHIKEQMIVSSMRGANVEQHITVAPEEVLARYESNRPAYHTPEKVHLRMIVVPRSAVASNDVRTVVESARERIAGGEDFTTVAREVSKGARASDGGDWGWMEPSVLRPELAAAAATLKAGQLSTIVETDKDYYLLQLVERQAAVQRSFPEVQVEIEKKIRAERGDKLYKEWVARLRQDAFVKVFDVQLF